MPFAADPAESADESDPRRPSWFALRIGIPVAIILAGLALAAVWKDRAGVLAVSTVQLGGREFHLKLKEEQGRLYGYARGSRGSHLVQDIAALDTALEAGGPLLARQEIRNATVVVDRNRREAYFVLRRGAIVFDGEGFSLRGAPEAKPQAGRR